MKKGLLASLLTVALLGGIAYANTTNAATSGARHMAAMHRMTSGQMMYDRDCPGLTDSTARRTDDRQFAGTVTADKLNELQQEIMR